MRWLDNCPLHFYPTIYAKAMAVDVSVVGIITRCLGALRSGAFFVPTVNRSCKPFPLNVCGACVVCGGVCHRRGLLSCLPSDGVACGVRRACPDVCPCAASSCCLGVSFVTACRRSGVLMVAKTCACCVCPSWGCVRPAVCLPSLLMVALLGCPDGV